MAISIKTCPHCKNTVSTLYSIDIGKPFVECSNCGHLVIDKDITEWELKDIFQKIYFLVICLYSAFLFGFLPNLIYIFLVDDIDEGALLGIWLTASCCIALFGSRNLIDEIKESKERMRDPEYRQVLRSIGLLKH